MNTFFIKGQVKRKRGCLLLALTLLTAFSFGQVRISGKITSTGGTPAESVGVTVKGTRFGGMADINGFYGFRAGLTPGRYTLVFTGVGSGV